MKARERVPIAQVFDRVEAEEAMSDLLADTDIRSVREA
jgi:hypothetical protein